MKIQSRNPESFKSIGPVAIGLAIFILSVSLDRTAPQFSELLCGASQAVLGALPSIVITAWQGLQGNALDHHGICGCLLQVLLSYGPLFLAGGR